MSPQEAGVVNESSLLRDGVRRKITDLYRLDAQQIVASLGKSPLCVVTGPFGLGKSTFLIPAIVEATQAAGINTVVKNGEGRDDRKAIFNGLLPQATSASVLILDNAGRITVDQARARENTAKLLHAAHQKGYSVVPVIPYVRDAFRPRDNLVTLWCQAERKEGGESGSHHDVKHPSIEPDLAREFVLANVDLPEDMIRYILSVFPPNIHVLSKAALLARDALNASRNPRGFMRDYILQDPFMWSRVLSGSEMEEIRDRVSQSFRLD